MHTKDPTNLAYLSYSNTFRQRPLGKALVNGLDRDSFSIMITYVSPHIDQEKITSSVLEYSHLFQLNRKEKIVIKDDMRIGMDLIKLEFDKINASLIKIIEYQEKYKLDQNQIKAIIIQRNCKMMLNS